jgi:hypothetical protein
LYAGSGRDLEDAKGIIDMQAIKKAEMDWLISKVNAFRLSKKLARISRRR